MRVWENSVWNSFGLRFCTAAIPERCGIRNWKSFFFFRERSGAAYSKSSAAVILEDLARYLLDDSQPVECGHHRHHYDALPGAAGYAGTAAVQTETALSAIQNLYLLAPCPL